MDRPLISFVMTCYNHEHVIAEALAAAFAQDYTPLEIIVSDDCSVDESFAVIERTVAAYDGPARVVTNRNPRNLGIAGNVDVACALAKGELVVIAAGDDRSLPRRISRTVAAWLATDRRADLIHAACVTMDGDRTVLHAPVAMQGTPTPQQVIENYLYAIGASMAFSKRCLTEFGPIAEHALVEDHVIPFRASLLGEIAYIDEPLVEKRPGGIANLARAESGHDRLFGLHLKELPWKIGDYRQFELDLAHVERADRGAILAAIRRGQALHEMEYRMATAGPMRRLAMLPVEAGGALLTLHKSRLKRAILYAGGALSIHWLDRNRSAA